MSVAKIFFTPIKRMFHAIICVDSTGRGIGKNNGIPFKNTEDLKNFKRITEGHIVIMGGNTWRSLPKKLPNRLNVVISRSIKSENNKPDMVFNTIRECVIYLSNPQFKEKQKYVIGGAQIYDWFFEQKLINRLFLTEVEHNFNCDVKIAGIPFGCFRSIHSYETALVSALIKSAATMHKWSYSELQYINYTEMEFLNTLKNIMTNGVVQIDRTNVGTRSVFGTYLKFDLSNNTIPLSTTKRSSLRMIMEELLWILRGQTNANILSEKGIKVWNPNTTTEFLQKRGLPYNAGDIGSTYGFSLRHFGADYNGMHENYNGKGFDQLKEVIRLIKEEPTSRRIILNLWNPASLHKCALPPCLFCYEFYVDTVERTLSCIMVQRSSDISLAGYWNVGTGSLLTHMLARITGLKAKELHWSICNAHIYLNQESAVNEQLDRTPRTFPKLYFKETAPSLENGKDITEFEYSDLILVGYNPYPPIKSILNA